MTELREQRPSSDEALVYRSWRVATARTEGMFFKSVSGASEKELPKFLGCQSEWSRQKVGKVLGGDRV